MNDRFINSLFRLPSNAFINNLCTGLMVLLSATLSSTADADDHGSGLKFDSTEITPGIHMLFGVDGFSGGNIGLTVGDDGVAMIDNGVASAITILREHVAQITDKPIDYLINTHVHGDHIGNNIAFGQDGARIISHDNLRKSLVAEGKAGKAAIPALTFADQMSLHINGDQAVIEHVANAHTDGDAIIKFQNANVIHTGDVMFNGLFPFIDSNNGGSLTGAIAALEKIESMADANTQIIPGHGPLASRADVGKTIAMLKDAYELVAAMVKDGKTDAQIKAADPLSKYQSYSWNFITTEKMTEQVIRAARAPQ